MTASRCPDCGTPLLSGGISTDDEWVVPFSLERYPDPDRPGVTVIEAHTDDRCSAARDRGMVER